MVKEAVVRYFKLLVCPYESGKTPGYWVERVQRQILGGKAHFGWSWIPTADLRKLREKLEREEQLKGDERVVWEKTRFLLDIEPGDRLIIQTERPLRRFLVAEVTGPYGFLGTEPDFNHYLECRAITGEYVNIDSVPRYVQRGLTWPPRRYYQIHRKAII